MSLGSGCFAQLRQVAIGCISIMFSMLCEGNCKTRHDPLQPSRTEKLAKNWPSILFLKLFSESNQTPCCFVETFFEMERLGRNET